MGAFTERVTRRFRIDRSEIAFLERLEENPLPIKRGHIIVQEGDTAAHAFVLMTGWVMSCSRFPDGSHQVRRLHFPGDLLAMPSVPMRHHAEDLEALSDAVIAPFSKRMFAELFNMPRLAGIMYMFAQAERITAGDRLASLGRDPAKARVAFLLVDILHRLRSTDDTVTNKFFLHLSREQIAHVTGITPVHASRTWSALITDGLVWCDGRTVTIIDEERLAHLGHYSDRDGDFDFHWLRAVEDQTNAASVE
jgi:CRP/FNR family transcriptional regulator, anaerobic regulatory protein